MKLSKKFICIIAIALVVAAALCWLLPIAIYGGKVVISNKNYVVTEKDGVFTLNFSSRNDQLNTAPTGSVAPDMNISIAAPFVEFANFEELRADIKSGDFTEEELGNIARFNRDEENRVIVPDINEIYAPVFPERLQSRFSLSFVQWGNYDFFSQFYNYGKAGSTEVYVDELQKAHFDEAVAEEFTDPVKRLEYIGNDIIDVRAGEYEDSTIVKYRSYAGLIVENHYYTISKDGKTLYVVESFYLNKTLPESIEIYVNQNDHYFRIELFKCTFRPTYEEIAQIYFEKV